MTIKDLFRLLLKLFGLYFIVAVMFTVIPGVILSFQEVELAAVFGILLIILILGALFFFLIFKADAVVNVLHLDRGFDSPMIPFEKMDALTVLKVGCIVVGGFLVVDNLAPLLSNGYQLLKGSVQGSFEQTLFGAPDVKQDFALNSLNLLIGYILITNYHTISGWLNQNRKSNSGDMNME